MIKLERVLKPALVVVIIVIVTVGDILIGSAFKQSLSFLCKEEIEGEHQYIRAWVQKMPQPQSDIANCRC